MDHYTELVLAHAAGPDGQRWPEGIELEIIKDHLSIESAPLVQGSECQWSPVKVLPRGWIEWDALRDCDECGGRGYVTYLGKRRSREIDCPDCDGAGFDESLPDVRIISNEYGVFQRYAEGFKPA